jgi:signal transduction histidine kinase
VPVASVRSGGARSIRTKLLLLVSTIMVAALLLGGLLVRKLVADGFTRQHVRSAEILTTSIVHDLTYVSGRKDPDTWQRIVEKYVTYYREIVGIAIFDSAATVVAAEQTAEVGSASRNPTVLAALSEAKPNLTVLHPLGGGYAVRSVAPLMGGSRVVGAVEMDITMGTLQSTLQQMDRQLVILGLAVLALVSVSLLVGLRGVVLLRLRRLMEVTAEIRSGRLDSRIGDASRDEIGSLGQALDSMTSELQASRQQIEDHNRLLTQRVREATAELARAYGDLQNAQAQLILNEKMATLGVLIAGVAHEINTPVGAIINISRNLRHQVSSMPDAVFAIRDSSVDPELLRACLHDVLAASMAPQATVPYQVQRAVERQLVELGVTKARERAVVLCRLSLVDPATIARYAPCFKVDALFPLVESSGAVAQAATIAESSGQKISEIVKALKYYAYADNEKMGSVQVNESLQTALVLLRSQLKHNLEVDLALAPDLPPITCSNDIHQVWTNLITNACDAIASTGREKGGRLSLATRREGDTVVVRIADDGMGIPPEYRDRIFDPFFTTKDIGKGTGLGLSIVSGIVKKHGGEIRLTSEPGCTVFEIVLPLEVPGSATAPAEGEPRSALADAELREAS